MIFLVLGTGCQEESKPTTRKIFISGRFQKDPVYQIEVPLEWEVIYPSSQDLRNTMLPLLTCKIDSETLITFHNFPSDRLEKRIAPEAQITRWEKQIAWKTTDLIPYTSQGFGGFRFEAIGDQEAMIGYAMQLTPQLYRLLPHSMDTRSDWTIKATGNKNAIYRCQKKIDAMAESLELMEAIRLPA